MITYPDINPVALHIGPLAIYWYGLMYAVAMLIGWQLALYRSKQPNSPVKPEEVSDLILFWGILGVVLGGRIGYVLFYQFSTFLEHPLYLFGIGEGGMSFQGGLRGMSFHGGLIGVILIMLLYAKLHHLSILVLMDFIAPVVPIGLGLGRIGNFINGELWGRVTTVPWGMVFPGADGMIRHPTQLYQAFGEGVIFFALIWWYSSKPRKPGQVSGMFLLGYGIIRFLIEYLREPDPHLGFVLFNSITQGQLLCIPMILLGLYLLLIRSHYARIPGSDATRH